MAVILEKNKDLDLTIFKASGKVPFEEQIKAMKQFYTEAPTKNVIWDYTEAIEIMTKNTEVLATVQYAKENAEKRKEGRTAFVANTKLKYGISRMVAIYADIKDLPVAMEVFENIDSAIAWIAE